MQHELREVGPLDAELRRMQQQTDSFQELVAKQRREIDREIASRDDPSDSSVWAAVLTLVIMTAAFVILIRRERKRANRPRAIAEAARDVCYMVFEERDHTEIDKTIDALRLAKGESECFVMALKATLATLPIPWHRTDIPKTIAQIVVRVRAIT
jgi:hypothetical protein